MITRTLNAACTVFARGFVSLVWGVDRTLARTSRTP